MKRRSILLSKKKVAACAALVASLFVLASSALGLFPSKTKPGDGIVARPLPMIFRTRDFLCQPPLGYYTRIGTSFQTIGTAFRSIGTVILPSSAHPQDIDFKGPTAIESNRALSATRYSSLQCVCRISLSR